MIAYFIVNSYWAMVCYFGQVSQHVTPVNETNIFSWHFKNNFSINAKFIMHYGGYSSCIFGWKML